MPKGILHKMSKGKGHGSSPASSRPRGGPFVFEISDQQLLYCCAAVHCSMIEDLKFFRLLVALAWFFSGYL